MSYRSAASDLYERTLSRISTLFGKIVFLGGTRQGETYSHWGLARIYGQAETPKAIAEAHTRCFLELLRSSFPSQLADAARHAIESGASRTAFLKSLYEGRAAITPSEVAGGSPEHLDWSLFVLANCSEDAAGYSDRAA